MERTGLNAGIREAGKGLAGRLRTEGKVPAILYGRGHDPVSLTVDEKAFLKVIHTSAGRNVLIDLNIDDKEKVLARVRDVQVHPVYQGTLHVDFQIVNLTEKIEVEVPVHLEGKSIGVKEGGVLDISRRSLMLRCLPTSIPEFISVDISALQIGDSIHNNDITLPEGVEYQHNENFSIVQVVAPIAEEEVVATEAVAPAAVPTTAQSAADAVEDAPAKKGEKKSS